MRRAREIRQEAELSLMDVARETPIHLTHLGRFERGLSNLGASRLQVLAAFYSTRLGRVIPIDDLLEEAAAVG